MGQGRKGAAHMKKKWLRVIDAARYTSSIRNQTTIHSRQSMQEDLLHGKGKHILSLMYPSSLIGNLFHSNSRLASYSAKNATAPITLTPAFKAKTSDQF